MEEPMRKILLTIGVAGLLLCSGPAARADDQGGDWQRQFHLRVEDLDKLMQGMDELLQSIPRYEAPTIDENGDIIIRRVPRDPEHAPEAVPTEPEFADI
jgi:hypothetical protein